MKQKGFRYWKVYACSYNEITGCHERCDFDLELYHPTNDHEFIEYFLKYYCLEIIIDGKKIIRDMILVMSKEASRMTFTVTQ